MYCGDHKVYFDVWQTDSWLFALSKMGLTSLTVHLLFSVQALVVEASIGVPPRITRFEAAMGFKFQQVMTMSCKCVAFLSISVFEEFKTTNVWAAYGIQSSGWLRSLRPLFAQAERLREKLFTTWVTNWYPETHIPVPLDINECSYFDKFSV